MASSTQVLDTYVADFHGTTVTLFEKQSPDAETNKPVCFDCHGVHDIRRTDDPEKGLQMRENLLARCQVCHPDATSNFPDAWLSHYIPPPRRRRWSSPWISSTSSSSPACWAAWRLIVALDASWRVRRRLAARRQPEAGPTGAAETEASQTPVADSTEPAQADPAPEEPEPDPADG